MELNFSPFSISQLFECGVVVLPQHESGERDGADSSAAAAAAAAAAESEISKSPLPVTVALSENTDARVAEDDIIIITDDFEEVALNPTQHQQQPDDATAAPRRAAAAATEDQGSPRCWLCLEHPPVDAATPFFVAGLCHPLCHECFEQVVRRAVSISAVVTCGDCSQIIQDNHVHQVLTESEERAQYARVKLLRSDAAMRECPKCGDVVKGSESSPNMQCNLCHTTYCFHHSLAHEGRTCKGIKFDSDGVGDWLWKKMKTVKCPSCKRRVQRNGGCAHMTCLCGFQFCYHCRRDWREIDYSHFRFFNFKQNGCRAPRFIVAKASLVILGGPLALAAAPFVGIGYGIIRLRRHIRSRRA